MSALYFCLRLYIVFTSLRHIQLICYTLFLLTTNSHNYQFHSQIKNFSSETAFESQKRVNKLFPWIRAEIKQHFQWNFCCQKYKQGLASCEVVHEFSVSEQRRKFTLTFIKLFLMGESYSQVQLWFINERCCSQNLVLFL